jgi:hypothetical protein
MYRTRMTLDIAENINHAYAAGQHAEHALTVPIVTLVTTGQLAAELGVSRSAVLKWHRPD